MDTDIIAGVESGMETILVFSGVTCREDIARYPYQPKKRERWLSVPHPLLEGKTPLESMLEHGLPAIKEVRVVAESGDVTIHKSG